MVPAKKGISEPGLMMLLCDEAQVLHKPNRLYTSPLYLWCTHVCQRKHMRLGNVRMSHCALEGGNTGNTVSNICLNKVSRSHMHRRHHIPNPPHMQSSSQISDPPTWTPQSPRSAFSEGSAAAAHRPAGPAGQGRNAAGHLTAPSHPLGDRSLAVTCL